MGGEKNMCVICAWREHCQKKFSLPVGANCPDFTRDLTIKEKTEEVKGSDAGKRGNK